MNVYIKWVMTTMRINTDSVCNSISIMSELDVQFMRYEKCSRGEQ